MACPFICPTTFSMGYRHKSTQGETRLFTHTAFRYLQLLAHSILLSIYNTANFSIITRPISIFFNNYITSLYATHKADTGDPKGAHTRTRNGLVHISATLWAIFGSSFCTELNTFETADFLQLYERFSAA